MANVRDSDTSLWLHNKLGTSNDSWTGGSICSQLNAEVLRNIKDCFPDLQTQVKLKLLLSFFHIPRRNVEEWKVELEEILEIALVDSDQWVSMLAETMKSYPSTGSLNTNVGDIDENKRIFSDLVNDLKKLIKKQSELTMLPLECHYLNKSALISIVGQQPQPVKHFTLKRKPKSAALRVELLQKSADACNSIKKSAAPTVPIRSRGMPRKMTDTTPLKGIPSRVPTGGFRTSITSPQIPRPFPRTPTAGRKDGGIKLLEITEQPIGYTQAKKRKKLQEMEEAKKAEAVAAAEKAANAAAVAAGTVASATATPDYAAGLTATAASSGQPAAGYSAVPTIVTAVNVTASTSATLETKMDTVPISTMAATYAPLPHTEPTIISPVVESIPKHDEIETTKTIITTHVVAAPQPQPQPQPQPMQTTQTVKSKLSLSRDQMLEAQEMFRNANKVTRPEKALILGFMAGSRENPCPHLGNVVTIKLSENEEKVIQEGQITVRTVETHFQMNYSTGEWKRIKKSRRDDEEAPMAAVAVLPASSVAQASSAL